MESDTQLTLDFAQSSTQRTRKAINGMDQLTLFTTWIPNVDVSLYSPKEAVAVIAANADNLDQAVAWLKKLVGPLRKINARRHVFPAKNLHKLAWVRPPANITLDSQAKAVAVAQHAQALGLGGPKVVYYRNRISAQNKRGWPNGFKFKDVDWPAIHACIELGIDLDIEDRAQLPVLQKLDKTSTQTITAALTGSTVTLTTRRPALLEKMELPGLSYRGEPGDGLFKLPLLLAAPLLEHKTIKIDDKTRKAIKDAVKKPKPLVLEDSFPWTLWDFQAVDAGKGLHILQQTGGVLFAGDMGSGKAVSCSSRLVTPNGLRVAAAIQVGDQLIGSNGKFTTVLGVYPQGVQPIYKIQFHDGTSAHTTADHLWSVLDEHRNKSTITTAQLQKNPGNWSVKAISGPVQYHDVPMAQQKSLQRRASVLRDLLSDGEVFHAGTADHAKEVAALGESLGAIATVTGRTVSFELPEWLGGYPTNPPLVRRVESVTHIGSEEAVCFQVDAPDKLFLLEHAIPTHNTTVSLGVAHHLDLFPLLVVAPLSAFSTWQRQLGEMGKNAYLCMGSGKKIWQDLEENHYDAVVISYDKLGTFDELLRTLHFEGLIADELQRVRNAGSKRSRALRAFAGNVPYRIGLSGTPLVNGLPDLLAQGAFLTPGEWNPRATTKSLEDVYPGDPVEAVAEHLGSMMVRRKLSEVGKQLPKRKDIRMKVPITAEQRAAIQELQEMAEKAKESGEFDGPQGKFNALVKLTMMRKIIANPASAGVAGKNPKVEAGIKVVKESLAAGESGVVFALDKASFIEFGEELTKAGIKWGGINGSTPAEERVAVEKRYHDEEIDIVLCSAAASESWSASKRKNCRLYLQLSYYYTYSAEQQSVARCVRLDSSLEGGPIKVVFLHATDEVTGSTVDDRLQEIVTSKAQLFTQVVDREVFEQNVEDVHSTGDLVYMLTGKRDEKLDKLEADKKKADKAHKKSRDTAIKNLHSKKNLRKGKE